jgi:hypothetical protein
MYSSKIIRYYINDSLELKGYERACNKAIYQAKSIEELIYYSDRGKQYLHANTHNRKDSTQYDRRKSLS